MARQRLFQAKQQSALLRKRYDTRQRSCCMAAWERGLGNCALWPKPDRRAICELQHDRDGRDRCFESDPAALHLRRAASVRPAAALFLLSSSFCERSEEHTSELQSLMRISYAVF